MLTCLSCGQPIVDTHAAFCPHCGQSLSSAAGQPPVPSPASGQANRPNASSTPTSAATLAGAFSAPSLATPRPLPGQVPPGKLPGQQARRSHLLPGIGGLVCGPLSILAFFILPWWLYVFTPNPAWNETLSAWALTNPALAPNAPSFVLLLWLIPASGLLLGLLGLLHVVKAGSEKRLSLIQLVGALIGLTAVAGYFSYVQWDMHRVSSEVHLSYGPGFWFALLAFVGIFMFAMVDLIRQR